MEAFVGVFAGTPRSHNDTWAEVQRHAREMEWQAADRERLRREHQDREDRIRREMEEKAQQERERNDRKQRDEAERYENERRRAREEIERQKAEAKAETEEIRRAAAQNAEEGRLRHEQEKQRLAKESEARLAAQKAEAERILQEEQAEAKRQKEEMDRKQAELQAKYMAGIHPEVWPTSEERKRAEELLLHPREEHFHCAIAGLAGSGKSSLINAFRGLRNHPAPGVAPTGITETTLTITAYRDPATEPPRSRFVWYDIPGAGTLKIKGWQYFNSQGLFVFDLIFVVVDNRFSEQDLVILQHCERYKIPSIIVRSKANQHIGNLMRQTYAWDGSDDERDFDEVYLEAREAFIATTRASIRENLSAGGLNPNKPIHIVSCDALVSLIQEDQRRLRKLNQVIDEPQLIVELYSTVKERRY